MQELGFRNLPIVTTREKRVGELDGIDKEFVTSKQFDQLQQAGITQVNFEFLGAKYGYRKEYLQSQENQVTEVHYSTIYEFRKCVKDIFAIYMVPYNIERAKLELQKRNLPEKVYQKRLEEIDEHVKQYENNQHLKKQFDYVFLNDYTENSNQKLIQILKEKLEKV